MGDTISRRKAFEYFVELWECIGTIIDRDEWEDVCMTTANEIPSAQPEQKKGKWVWNEDGVDWGLGAWCCSRCGRKPETWWESDKRKNPLRCAGGRFCGNCGADMSGNDYGDWVCTTEYMLFPFKCPNCGRHQTKATKFCPNCGADMKV